MDLKTLMFLRSCSAEKEEVEYPIYFSATGVISPNGSPTLTNSFGTTINKTSADTNSVEVTQVYNPNPSNKIYSYNNGFVCIGFDKILDWSAEGKTLVFDADIDFSVNPESVTELTVYVNSRGKPNPVVDGKIHAEIGNLGVHSKGYVEIRCSGCSFTVSNCRLSYIE